jgi:ABC-type antimicrobial peptide transport system permease subunit
VVAALELYWVMVFMVERPTREFGIGMVMGARQATVLSMAKAEMLTLTGVGVPIGFAGGVPQHG